MKRIFISFALLGVIFSASLWAHHMAEGIISADLWEQIDSRVSDIHDDQIDDMLDGVTIDDSQMMNDMEIFVDEASETVYLKSNVTVYFDESVSESEYDDLIQELMDRVVLPTTDEMNRLPAGTQVDNVDDFDSRTVYFTVTDVLLPDGSTDYFEIYLYEPIGQGESGSQVVPPEEPSTPPGKRAGG